MIRLRRDGPVAILSLDRPHAKNALAVAAWDALAEHTGRMGDARAVVLRSDVPGIFSAGADIAEFARLQDDPPLRSRFRAAMRAGIEAVAALPVPVIAAVDGGCFGAAVALALAADIRVAGDDARFATTPARLGLGYPREDVVRLAARVGRGQAAAMLFLAEQLDADAAHRIGLVERRAVQAGPEALALAQRIAGFAPDAIRLLKRTLVEPADPGLDAAFEDAFGSEAFAAGLAAFRARSRG